MSAVVTELENALQAMQATKAPGVSGTKINQITELSLRNVQVLFPIVFNGRSSHLSQKKVDCIVEANIRLLTFVIISL